MIDTGKSINIDPLYHSILNPLVDLDLRLRTPYLEATGCHACCCRRRQGWARGAEPNAKEPPGIAPRGDLLDVISNRHITQELSFHYIIFASPLFALAKVPRFCHEIQGSLPVTPGEISIGGFLQVRLSPPLISFHRR